MKCFETGEAEKINILAHRFRSAAAIDGLNIVYKISYENKIDLFLKQLTMTASHLPALVVFSVHSQFEVFL